jgi:hypothetical protein
MIETLVPFARDAITRPVHGLRRKFKADEGFFKVTIPYFDELLGDTVVDDVVCVEVDM